MSESPFANDPDRDAALATAAAAGDRTALETLVRLHQPWIYSMALRMMLKPQDAADVAQEALIRIVTRLGQFEGRSQFRTWAYRIVVRCFLDAKRGAMESNISSFESYGKELTEIPDHPFSPSNPEQALLVEEAKLGCMLGMLLCLDRDQRIAYILGAIFECPSEAAAEILEISPAAFRKRLQRARRDLTAFMRDQCGLLNPDNPCRCPKKTKSFIQYGWVDPKHLRFTGPHLTLLRDQIPDRAQRLDVLYEDRAAGLFKDHPLHLGPETAEWLGRLLAHPEVQDVFSLSS